MSEHLHIIINEEVLRKLVLEHLRDKINYPLEAKDVKIEVKSTQNYKAEWEVATFRAEIKVDLSIRT